MTITDQKVQANFLEQEARLSEQQKVHEIYSLIGERGLYVNTNFDMFTTPVEEVQVSGRHTVPLMKQPGKSYASPLLFAALTSLMNHGTMLITGAPGIGKTTSAEYAGHFFTGTSLEEILSAEIQGHTQLTREEIVASYEIAQLTQGKRVVIPSKLMQCPVKILDEVNRMPPEIPSIIMRLVDTGKAVYGGEILKSPPGPLFATANYADEGTFELTPPFLDRFDVAVMVTSPQPDDLKEIRKRGDDKLNGPIEERLKIPDYLHLDFDKVRKEIRELPEPSVAGITEDIGVVSAFADFVYSIMRFSDSASDNLARSTKGNLRSKAVIDSHFAASASAFTANEMSVRSVLAMNRYAKAYAWFLGKKQVELDDLKAIMPYVLWHKVNPTSKGVEGSPKLMNDRIGFVKYLVEKIEAEYTSASGSAALSNMNAALKAVRERKFKGQELTQDQIGNVVRKAIAEIGREDSPWALLMASHVASEYNRKIMGG